MIEAFLGMVVFGLLMGGLVLVVTVISLRNRVANLERIVRQEPTAGRAETDDALQTATNIAAMAPQPTAILPADEPLTIGPGITSADRFFKWVREDWLLKLGALLLLVGLSWLTSYAFLHDWIGPKGRISFGLILGTGILALSWWRIKKFVHQGGIFLVLGSTTILVTIYAAREVYDFFTPATALIVMFLSTALVALASVKYNSRSLALSSIILAGIAPLLTNSPTPNHVALFSYLLVVTLGVIWIVFVIGARGLLIAALSMVSFYSLPYLNRVPRSDSSVMLLFAFVFTAVFFVANSAGIVVSKSRKYLADLTAAAWTGMFILSWIMARAPQEWRSLLLAAWMIVFVAGAFWVSRRTKQSAPFYVYAGVGVVLLGAATSAELSGATLTIAYTLECAVVVVLTYLLRRDLRFSQRISALLLIPLSLSFRSFDLYTWQESVFNRHFFVLAVIAITLAGLGLFFRRIAAAEVKTSTRFSNALIVAGTIYACALLWLTLHSVLERPDLAVAISLLAYTIVGLITYIRGRAAGTKGLVLYGGCMLGFVVLRLLSIDVWKMEVTGRIITFLLVGTLLMSTAFLVKNRQAAKNREPED